MPTASLGSAHDPHHPIPRPHEPRVDGLPQRHPTHARAIAVAGPLATGCADHGSVAGGYRRRTVRARHCCGVGVVSALVYHGTPMTPRAALLDVCAGRAMCVSFWRPDDVEAVEAISPAIMFRQRRVFRVAGGAEARRGMVHPRGLVALFRVVGAAPVSARSLGCDAGRTGCAEPAQRCAREGMAVRGPWRAAVAHGRAYRAAVAAVREAPARLPWLDRGGQASGPARISRAHGRSGQGFRQPLARRSHDARNRGQGSLAVRIGGRDDTRAKRVAL